MHKTLAMKDTSYKYYMLTILLLIQAFNNVDRGLISVVLQDIKLELALSDTQLGLLTGIAFALFYAIMGIPIARWADRGNRVTILTVTTALFSGMAALCGMATSFVQLLLVRVGVAVGEAGSFPVAHSLIADYFNRAERPRATSIFMLGGPLGMVITYFAGGWLNELYGWRVTFIALGAPGLLLAALAWFTLREPRLQTRKAAKAADVVPTAITPPTLSVVITTLWQIPTFRHVLITLTLMGFFGYGIGQWLPTFFIRSHDMATGELGTWFALIWGVGGGMGMYLGGYLASRFAANNERLQFRTIAIVIAVFGISSVFIYLSPSKTLALSLMGAAALVVTSLYGPLYAILQTLVPDNMRAVAFAFALLLSNLVGLGLGPLAVGMLSDAFSSNYGQDALRYALVAFCPGYLWMGVHLWLASKTVQADLAATQVQENDETASASTLKPAEAN